MKSKLLLVLFAVFIVIACFFIKKTIDNAWMSMSTHDTIGQAMVAAGNIDDFSEIRDFVRIAIDRFPGIPHMDGVLLDGWGRNIDVFFVEDGENLKIRLLSRGADGLVGTDDDIEEVIYFRKDRAVSPK